MTFTINLHGALSIAWFVSLIGILVWGARAEPYDPLPFTAALVWIGLGIGLTLGLLL
jgi:hypothetical protein